MARHHLTDRAAPADLVRVAGDLCGLHAQVMSCAELSLWARIDGLDRDAVRQALWVDRSLVKLWAARGTLYLLPAAELGVWLSALGTLTKFGNQHPVMADLAGAVGRALSGRVLTRAELALAVEQDTGSARFGEWLRGSWGSYLKAASFRGLICFAPGTGTQVRFTAPATWVPGGITRPAPEEAIGEITRRFLGGYAPATAEDLTRWWLGPPRPRQGVAMLAAAGEEAAEVDVEGKRARVLARDLPGVLSAAPAGAARLLPAFDPWVIGAARHAPLFDPPHVARVYRPQGWVSPVLLVNGRIADVWKHERTGRRLAVEIEPFGRLPAWARQQLSHEAERLAAFLGCEPAPVVRA
jgi:hypothetical protein